MAKYRPVDVRLWSDRKFNELSSDARLLWVFLLTAPNALPIPGVILGGDLAISEQLGVQPELLRGLFDELFSKGLSIRREGRLIWLPNAMKYQPPRNPNMIKGWSAVWDDVPECQLKLEIWQALELATKSWSRLFARLFRRPFEPLFDPLLEKQKHQDQDQDQEQEQEREGALSLFPDWIPRIGSEAALQLERMGPAGNRSRMKFLAHVNGTKFRSVEQAESRLLTWLYNERDTRDAPSTNGANGSSSSSVSHPRTPMPPPLFVDEKEREEAARIAREFTKRFAQEHDE